jgi:hypothetical protein
MRESQSSEIQDVITASPRPSSAPRNERYLEYQHGILQLHQMTKIPPSIKLLNGEVTKESTLPVVGGTYSDIWIGYWLGEQKVGPLILFGRPLTNDLSPGRTKSLTERQRFRS